MKKDHRKINFNQEAWIKSYSDKNTKQRQKAKNDFEKDCFKLMINAVFGKTMEYVRKHRNINFAAIERIRNCLVPEPNYHSKKRFTEHLLAIEMRKTEILINKSLFRFINLRSEWNCNIWILVWLCKTKIWWKCKNML